MWFLGLGLLFLLMKFLDIAPVVAWPWWGVLAPFGLAVLWWAWADSSGYTKQRAIDKENKRKAARIERQRESIGMPSRRKK